MEEQDILNYETGTKETISLQPATVEIKEVSIKTVGEKGNKKIMCLVKHPAKEEVVEVSSAKYEKAEKLTVSGLWINFEKDDQGKETEKLQKGSALTNFMKFKEAKTPKELVGKNCETVLDDKGFLCFKAY